MPKPTVRNPMAASLRTNGLYRPKAAKSTDERARQRDAWDRTAKHKSRDDVELEEGFQHGDFVELDGGVDEEGKLVKKKGMVKNPKGPMGMLGITVDGEYSLVSEDDVKLVTEALARMIELSK